MTIHKFDKKVAVLGAGAFGTALAKLLAARYEVALWTRSTDLATTINSTHLHPARLKGIFLPDNIRACTELELAVESSSLIISALPLVSVVEVWRRAHQYMAPNALLLSVTKGIEEKTLRRPAEIFHEILSPAEFRRLSAMSGPTFAQELAAGLPAAATLASVDEKVGVELQQMISVDNFRVYLSADIAGVELGGALKNVIAIASGIGHGLNLGQNAQAALITRGIAEVTRLAVAMGADPSTLAGLSGLGDLVLTCSSTMSRNFRLGVALSQGVDITEAVAQINETVEGVNTAKSVCLLGAKYQIEMPISEGIQRILFEQASPRQILYDLMTRKLKHELE